MGFADQWGEGAISPSLLQATNESLTSLVGYTVGPFTYEGLAPSSIEQFSSAPADANWQAINRALLFPLILPSNLDVVQCFMVNGAAVSGNSDIGLYDSGGNRLFHTGAINNVPAGLQGVTLNPFVYSLLKNTFYFLALSLDNATHRFRGLQPTSHEGSWGFWAAAASYPLPATITPTVSTVVTDIVPFFGLTSLAVI